MEKLCYKALIEQALHRPVKKSYNNEDKINFIYPNIFSPFHYLSLEQTPPLK